MRAGAFLILAAMLSPAAHAADREPICADRPGKAWATCTVLPGHVEVDVGIAGWSLQKGAGERDAELAVGETEVRFGLTDRSEIAFDIAPYVRASSRGAGRHDSESGVSDLTIFSKNRLTADDAAVELAIVPLVKIPMAKRSLGNGKWEAALLAPVNYAVPNSPLSIALTPELDWVADADGRGHHLAMAQVAGIGWQASDKVNLSAELWGAWDWDPPGTTRQVSADGAVAYLLSNDVQLDAGANFGLNRNTPEVELYAGFAARF